MSIKQTITRILVGAFLVIGALFAPALSVSAATGNNGCETNTAIIHCDIDESAEGIEATGLWSVLLLALNILTAAVGVAALGGIVYGAIMYASAGGSVEQTKKALGIILNVVIGIVAYALMYAGLNFLIPGGIFT